MTIGERIKNARTLKGFTQEELAKKMGYSGKTSISKIESSGDNVTTTTVTRFARAIGVSEQYLMGWSEIDWDPKTQEIVEDDSNYYEDPEAADLAQFLHDNPGHKVLFDASRKVKAEDLEKALRAIGLFIDEE